jgi:hypothetical protein
MAYFMTTISLFIQKDDEKPTAIKKRVLQPRFKPGIS